MKSYGDDIDAILDVLELNYGIDEKLLEKKGILKYVTNRDNLQYVREFVIWVGRYKLDFKSKEHKTNYVLKILSDKMKHSN